MTWGKRYQPPPKCRICVAGRPCRIVTGDSDYQQDVCRVCHRYMTPLEAMAPKIQLVNREPTR